ncbi:MAG: hypothetical protein AB7E52_00725 [Bdellovibrionales bacterium]
MYCAQKKIDVFFLCGVQESDPQYTNAACVTETAKHLAVVGKPPIILAEATNLAGFMFQDHRINQNAKAGIHTWPLKKALIYAADPTLEIPQPHYEPPHYEPSFVSKLYHRLLSSFRAAATRQ